MIEKTVVVVISFSIIVSCLFISLLLVTVTVGYLLTVPEAVVINRTSCPSSQ